MEIKVRYENQVTTIQVPEEDFTVMIEMDYQERCAAADDPASITRRTPQEILDTEINRPDYNNWHRHWRHTDGDAIPPRLDHKAGFLSRNQDDSGAPHHYTVEDFPDVAGPLRQLTEESYEETCALVRRVLKPSYADMVIAIHIDGMKIVEYAALISDKPDNVSHRLHRAEKKLKDFFEKRLV